MLVIGGGIHGLAVAYEGRAARPATALVERPTSASGSSFNHQKTVHGGLRSLQTRRPREGAARSASAARSRGSRRRSSHRWRSSWGPRGVHAERPLAMRAGVPDRPRSGTIATTASSRTCACRPAACSGGDAYGPGSAGKPAQVTGGAQWYDYQMVERGSADAGVCRGGGAHGAVLANYVDATEAHPAQRPIVGITSATGCRDGDAGRRGAHDGERGGRGVPAQDGAVRRSAGLPPPQGDERRHEPPRRADGA